jgi:hypothetical protein
MMTRDAHPSEAPAPSYVSYSIVGPGQPAPRVDHREGEFFIDNLLVRIHLIIEMI